LAKIADLKLELEIDLFSIQLSKCKVKVIKDARPEQFRRYELYAICSSALKTLSELEIRPYGVR
jgi:hypothetical protein